MKLKTLEDLKEEYQKEADVYSMDDFERKLKALAIKWVKEDLRLSPPERYDYIMKWMKRLNITEEDLE